jgi:hypothetical protein
MTAAAAQWSHRLRAVFKGLRWMARAGRAVDRTGARGHGRRGGGGRCGPGLHRRATRQGCSRPGRPTRRGATAQGPARVGAAAAPPGRRAQFRVGGALSSCGPGRRASAGNTGRLALSGLRPPHAHALRHTEGAECRTRPRIARGEATERRRESRETRGNGEHLLRRPGSHLGLPRHSRTNALTGHFQADEGTL